MIGSFFILQFVGGGVLFSPLVKVKNIRYDILWRVKKRNQRHLLPLNAYLWTLSATWEDPGTEENGGSWILCTKEIAPIDELGFALLHSVSASPLSFLLYRCVFIHLAKICPMVHRSTSFENRRFPHSYTPSLQDRRDKLVGLICALAPRVKKKRRRWSINGFIFRGHLVRPIPVWLSG